MSEWSRKFRAVYIIKSKPSFLVPPQQAFLDMISKETQNDIVPKLFTIKNNRCFVL